MTNKKKKISQPLSLGNADGQNIRTIFKKISLKMDLHLRTTPLTTLKVFASHIETMLRIKDMGGRFLSNYLLEDNPGAKSYSIS